MAADMVQFDSSGVRHTAGRLAIRQQKIVECANVLVDDLADVAVLMQQADNVSKVNELREAVKHVLGAKHMANLQETVLKELQAHYEMSTATTDFGRQLEQQIEHLVAEEEYDVLHDDQYQAFEDAVGGNANNAEERFDDDVAIEHDAQQLAPNNRCPITSKVLLELEDPVVDSKGFVYERSAVLGYLRQSRPPVRCPVAGATHTITAPELKPARRVIKAQQRARQGRQQRQREGEDVLDVE